MGDVILAFGVAIIIGLCAAFIGVFGFNVGQAELRQKYAECIQLGAPQENCLKQMLGDK